METLPLLILLIVILYVLFKSIRILKEYERGVIFRLGRLVGGKAKGPGIILLIPFIDKLEKISLQTLVHDVPPQDVITRDNVSINVNAVVYFKVVSPHDAIIEVKDYYYATSQIAQTTLRSVLGQMELDDLLAERDKINAKLKNIIDEHTDPWGVQVTNVEVKQVDLPQEMQRAMARQAESERERRSKVIAAEGEFQASKRLSDAAEILDVHPSALTLRYLQTLREIGLERNTTTLFPLPMDILKPFIQKDVEKQVQKQSPDADASQ